MNTAERTRTAFTLGTPDRVPVHCWLGLPYIREHLIPPDKSMYEMMEWWIDDPMASLVQWQRDLGLDPMITTYSQHIGSQEIWPRMLFPRPFTTDTWDENMTVIARGDGWRQVEHIIETPAGQLDYNYRVEDGYGTATGSNDLSDLGAGGRVE